MAPSKDDLQALLEAGYTVADIQELAKGSSGELAFAVNKVRSGAGKRHGIGGQAGKLGWSPPKTTSITNLPLPQSSLSGQLRDPFTGGAGRDPVSGTGGIRNTGKSTRQTDKKKSVGLGEALSNTPIGRIIGGLTRQTNKSAIAQDAIDRALKAAEIAKRVNGAYRNAAGQAQAAPDVMGGEDIMGMGGDLYSPAPFEAPSFEYRDFTDQARGQVGGVYAPRYAAIDEAAKRANQQYSRSDQITAGLYQNLANNISKIAQNAAARTSQASQEQTDRTGQLVQDIGQNYSSTQAQEAALLQAMGQQDSAQQVLGNDSADAAYQQSRAQIEGAAQQANNTAQGQTQQDYLSNLSQANNTQGVFSRQQLLANLGDTLSGYEQDRFNLKGDEAAAALQLAQQLSDRDFQLQQANYGAYSDAYDANNQNAQFQANLSLQQAQNAQQQSQWQFEQAFRAQQNQREQANLDRQYQLDQAKYGTDLATALAQQRLDQQKFDAEQMGGEEGLNFDNQDPVSRIISQIANTANGDANKGKQYYDFVSQMVGGIDPASDTALQLTGSQAAFVNYIKQQAITRGLDPLVAQAAAASYWSNLYGKR